MSRAIREVSTGRVITVNEVSDVYGNNKQKILDGMVDGRRYVYADEKVEITADQAPDYLNEKLDELVAREAEVERREIDITTRFREVVEREITVEDQAAELAAKEKELSDRYSHLISRENEVEERHTHLNSRENDLLKRQEPVEVEESEVAAAPIEKKTRAKRQK